MKTDEKDSKEGKKKKKVILNIILYIIGILQPKRKI